MSKFGERLKFHREKLGLTQNELAEMAKVPGSSISHFEAGSREPAMTSLCRIADVLRVTTDSLLGRDQWERDIEGRLSYLENELSRYKKIFSKPYAEAIKEDLR